MRNVTIKPETTRRQDDVTGRLPRHASHSSPRMKQSWVKNSAYSSHKSAFPKVYNNIILTISSCMTGCCWTLKYLNMNRG